jgi:two-component system NtrC family sensor kinase
LEEDFKNNPFSLGSRKQGRINKQVIIEKPREDLFMNQNLRDIVDGQRVQALRAYDILDTESESAFDDIVWLAAHLFHAPIATIGFMDAGRLWFKAKRGITLSELPRHITICDRSIEQKNPIFISDLSRDSRYENHPIVTQDPGLRFYVAYPLVSPDGFALGTLCVMDIKAQHPTEEQMRGLGVLARQIVERLEFKKARNALAHQETELAENLRMRSVGQLSASIAHEINNPLSIIAGRAQVMKKALSEGNTNCFQKDLDLIESTCQRLVRVVRGFLRMARDGHADPFENVSLPLLIEEVLDLMKPRLEKNQIEVEICGAMDIALECRPIEISQVLMNLIGNSIDALTRSVEKKIQIAWYYLNERVVISISDTGPGIPTHLRQSIMKPFFTTKPPGQGTGLGLSISQGICESHGGALHLQASAQTEFLISLPVSQKNSDKIRFAA